MMQHVKEIQAAIDDINSVIEQLNSIKYRIGWVGASLPPEKKEE
ncbi:unnamed protein product [marine sediment metagenome]|uniref:Uncharacterized protein n=1 Tax=marine sediment metagenome TaxID=412755 RepID=X0ZE18_9ZZZZ